jgi:hypothetical protein
MAGLGGACSPLSQNLRPIMVIIIFQPGHGVSCHAIGSSSHEKKESRLAPRG